MLAVARILHVHLYKLPVIDNHPPPGHHIFNCAWLLIPMASVLQKIEDMGDLSGPYRRETVAVHLILIPQTRFKQTCRQRRRLKITFNLKRKRATKSTLNANASANYFKSQSCVLQSLQRSYPSYQLKLLRRLMVVANTVINTGNVFLTRLQSHKCCFQAFLFVSELFMCSTCLPVNFCGTEFLRLATLLASLSSRRARSVHM